MTELQTTHRTTVTEDMIDHLGHMNVRYYGVAARAASDAVVRELGGEGDLDVHAVDIYTRHFREQLLGAELEVRSLVLSRGGGSLRLYHELRNTETEDLAASFVHRLDARHGGELVTGWPPAGGSGDTDIPEHGRPRSISLDTAPLATAPGLADVRADTLLAMRLPRTIEADECRPDGSYDPSAAPFLLWGGEPLEGATGPTLHAGPDGQLVGWATMENRMVINRLPRRGDRIQSFGAVVEIRDKTTHRVMWGYDLDRGDLLVAFEVIDVALDTVSRRAVSIPDELRGHAEARHRPQLAPRVVSVGEQLG
jgi:acyl-CoA thioester hydrolase